jgi:hypothetical protein
MMPRWAVIALLVLFAVLVAGVCTDAIGTITLLNRQVQLSQRVDYLTQRVCVAANQVHEWEALVAAKRKLPAPLIPRENCR